MKDKPVLVKSSNPDHAPSKNVPAADWYTDAVRETGIDPAQINDPGTNPEGSPEGEAWVRETFQEAADDMISRDQSEHVPDTNVGDMPNDGSDGSIIRELPLSFQGTGEVKGYSFTQVRATPDGYIYRVDGCPVLPMGNCLDQTPVPSRDTHYEVFKRMVHTQFACVSYPRAKSFGSWAWTAETLGNAEDLFEKFVNKKSI